MTVKNNFDMFTEREWGWKIIFVLVWFTFTLVLSHKMNDTREKKNTSKYIQNVKHCSSMWMLLQSLSKLLDDELMLMSSVTTSHSYSCMCNARNIVIISVFNCERQLIYFLKQNICKIYILFVLHCNSSRFKCFSYIYLYGGCRLAGSFENNEREIWEKCC